MSSPMSRARKPDGASESEYRSDININNYLYNNMIINIYTSKLLRN